MLKENFNIYKTIYSELYSELKWKADKRTLMLIAAIYASSSKNFEKARFLEVADYIKSEVGLFSYLKSTQRFSTAATLDTHTESPIENFNRFIDIYEKLIETGFGRSVFTYIAAGTMLKVESSRIDKLAQKAADIYKVMQQQHFFLTNSSDYPMACILAQTEQDTESIALVVRNTYEALTKEGFAKGNDLQFLSHILTLQSDSPETSAQRCKNIQSLLESKLKIKKVYYPYLGMLSFLERVDLKELIEINNLLNSHFKWNKDINFMISVLLLSSTQLAMTGLSTSIEILIQAQQAAMTASIAAATVASSTTGE